MGDVTPCVGLFRGEKYIYSKGHSLNPFMDFFLERGSLKIKPDITLFSIFIYSLNSFFSPLKFYQGL